MATSTATTTYGPEGVTTATAPGAGYPVEDRTDWMRFFKAMAKRRMDADRPEPMRSTVGSAAPPAPMPGRDFGGPGLDPMKGMRREAEGAQLRALIEPAPMRLAHVGAGGMVPTLDITNMNAFQRQAHLPGGAGMDTSLTPEEQLRQQQELLWSQRMATDRAGSGGAGGWT